MTTAGQLFDREDQQMGFHCFQLNAEKIFVSHYMTYAAARAYALQEVQKPHAPRYLGRRRVQSDQASLIPWDGAAFP